MMTESQIKHMVDRFLMWKLPKEFAPDGGISFDPIASRGTPHEFRREPVGTNLLTATQADAMVRYMLEGMPSGVADCNRDTRAAIEAAPISGETR